jgi:hypothetical protein
MIGIDPDKIILPVSDQKKVANQQRTDKNEFQNFFKQAVDSTKTEDNAVVSTPYTSEIRPAQFETQTEPSTNMIVNQIDQLMATMEAYQHRLMESDATLKDIEPIVEKIAKQSESLSAISQEAKMEDNLKTIVNQSLSLSSKEIARYRSGHYNDD